MADPLDITSASPDSVTIDASVETLVGTMQGIWHDFVGHLPLIAAAIAVFVATALVAAITRRATARVLRHVHVRQSLKDLGERVVVFLTWIVGLLLAAMVVFPGITPSDALAALGIGSIAIGLAFKDIFENFFAGVLILWRFPFENGDFIECTGIEGRVVSVTVRNTFVQTVEGELIVIPNSTIYKNPVTVLTRQNSRRTTINCGVAYGESVADARRVIRAAVDAASTRDPARPVEIFAHGFASSSIEFEVTWWCGSTPAEIRASRDEIVEAVKTALDEAGIEIPFPHRTLTFRDDAALRLVDTSTRGVSPENA